MNYLRGRRLAIGLVLMALTYTLPLVLTDLAGGTAVASAQNEDCGYPQGIANYEFFEDDDRVQVRASTSPAADFLIANARNTVNEEVVMVRVNGGSSLVPESNSEYCTSLTATHLAGPTPRQRRFHRYSAVPPSDFRSSALPLSQGTWLIEYNVAVGVAETFDGKIHVYEDSFLKTIVVAGSPPCGGYDDAGPVAPDLGSRVTARMDLTGPAGSQVSQNIFRATTPTNQDKEWVFRATLDASSSVVQAKDKQDVCYTFSARPLAGNRNIPKSVTAQYGANLSPYLDLEPGRWEVSVEVRTTSFVDGNRYLKAIDRTSRTIDVASPVGLAPQTGLPAGVRVTAQAAGYHPQWGIAQTSWTNNQRLPQGKHWLRFRVQATASNGAPFDLASVDNLDRLRVLVQGPTGSYYLPHAEFTEGDETGYSYIQTNGVWNKLNRTGKYRIYVWMSDGSRSTWSSPITLNIT